MASPHEQVGSGTLPTAPEAPDDYFNTFFHVAHSTPPQRSAVAPADSAQTSLSLDPISTAHAVKNTADHSDSIFDAFNGTPAAAAGRPVLSVATNTSFAPPAATSPVESGFSVDLADLRTLAESTGPVSSPTRAGANIHSKPTPFRSQQTDGTRASGAASRDRNDEDVSDGWSCTVCTFLNSPLLQTCEMCGRGTQDGGRAASLSVTSRGNPPPVPPRHNRTVSLATQPTKHGNASAAYAAVAGSERPAWHQYPAMSTHSGYLPPARPPPQVSATTAALHAQSQAAQQAAAAGASRWSRYMPGFGGIMSNFRINGATATGSSASTASSTSNSSTAIKPMKGPVPPPRPESSTSTAAQSQPARLHHPTPPPTRPPQAAGMVPVGAVSTSSSGEETKPQWLQEMNDAWSNEITAMPAEKRQWFFNVKNGQWLNQLRQAWSTEVGASSDGSEDGVPNAFLSKQEELLAAPTTASAGPRDSQGAEAATTTAPAANSVRSDAPSTPTRVLQASSPSPSLPASTSASPITVPADGDPSSSPGATGSAGSKWGFVSRWFSSSAGAPKGAGDMSAGPRPDSPSRSDRGTSSANSGLKGPMPPPVRRAITTVTPTSMHPASDTEPTAANSAAAGSGQSSTVHSRSRSALSMFSSGSSSASPGGVSSVAVKSLVTYAGKLRKLLEEHERKMLVLQEERRKVRHQMKEETAKWKSYAEETLLSVAQNYYSTQLVLYSALLDIEAHQFEALSSAIQQLNLAAEGTRPLDPVFVDASAPDGLRRPAELERALAGAEVALRVQHCLDMREKNFQVGRNYMELQKKASKPESTAQRATRFVSLLQRAWGMRDRAFGPNVEAAIAAVATMASGGVADLAALEAMNAQLDTSYYWHALDPRTQEAFRRLISDERHREGQLLRQWREMVDSTAPDKVPARAILAYAEYMVQDIIKRYDLARSKELAETCPYVAAGLSHPIPDPRLLGPAVRLYVDRIVFPLVRHVIYSLNTPQERDADVKFRQQLVWVRRLTQEECGIEPMFRAPVLSAATPSMLILGAPQADADASQPHVTGSAVTPGPGLNPSVSASSSLIDTLGHPIQFLSGLDSTTSLNTSSSNRKPAESTSISNSMLSPSPSFGASPQPNHVHVPPNAELSLTGDADVDANAGPAMDPTLLPEWWPYRRAILSLTHLRDDVVPTDTLHRILECVRAVHEQATLYYNLNLQQQEQQAATADEVKSAIAVQAQSSIPDDESGVPLPPRSPSIASSTLHDSASLVLDATSIRAPPSPSGAPKASTSMPHANAVQSGPLSKPLQKVEISADSLFPIVVWVVTHAHVTHIHATIGQLERFVPENVKHFGEVGMALSLVEAAVAHICELTPAKVKGEVARPWLDDLDLNARVEPASIDESGDGAALGTSAMPIQSANPGSGDMLTAPTPGGPNDDAFSPSTDSKHGVEEKERESKGVLDEPSSEDEDDRALVSAILQENEANDDSCLPPVDAVDEDIAIAVPDATSDTGDPWTEIAKGTVPVDPPLNPQDQKLPDDLRERTLEERLASALHAHDTLNALQDVGLISTSPPLSPAPTSGDWGTTRGLAKAARDACAPSASSLNTSVQTLPDDDPLNVFLSEHSARHEA